VNQSNGLKGQPKKWVKQKHGRKLTPQKGHQENTNKKNPKLELCPLSNVGVFFFCLLRLLELDH